ncbi:UNVERIFIED_CONTAM: B-box zinc finger protein 22 [Sesamum latifolium]|uniref:B-box zinc finger protein 22 n=1 Tax=Sesamum latifolium TaxID=2727402 RepID=A0AAW2TP70_9LAMI
MLDLPVCFARGKKSLREVELVCVYESSYPAVCNDGSSGSSGSWAKLDAATVNELFSVPSIYFPNRVIFLLADDGCCLQWIEEETVGYFFCLEDRALLCRKCDVAIHTANPLVSGHQRFLLTGVKVGLEATETGSQSSSGKTHTTEKISELEPRSLPKKTNTPVSSSSQYSKSLPVQASVDGDFSMSKSPFAGGSYTGNISQWQLDEFIGLGDFTQNYNFMDNGSSKADSGKLGGSEDSQNLIAADGELEVDECMGQVPDTFWAVPQIPSPPTASGLYWPKNYQSLSDSTALYPM